MSNKKIRVAVVGTGNCAKSLIEGVALYGFLQPGRKDGLAFPSIGGYEVKDIEFVLAYDVDERKVNKLLDLAIYAKPNCALSLLPPDDQNAPDALYHACGNTRVKMGAVLDGVSDFMQSLPPDEGFVLSDVRDTNLDQVVADLKEAKVDVLLNYLPVGSQQATEFYIEACLQARVPFVNCIPVFVVSDPVWGERIKTAGIPAIGDDMRSGIGASIISAALQNLFIRRGGNVTLHYQDNVGGNTDFANMQVLSRLASKKTSKENVIHNQSKLNGVPIDKRNVHAGPAQYFPSLGDNKRAHWLIEGTIFGGAKFEFTADLSCQDSPNSAAVVIDAIRLLQVAKELGITGPLFGPSAWTQKTPPVDLSPDDAYAECCDLVNRILPSAYRS